MTDIKALLREAADWLNCDSHHHSEVLAKRLEAAAESLGGPTIFGCHVEVDVGEQVLEDCVLDHGRPQDCSHCSRNRIKKREDCEYWKPWRTVPQPEES